MYHEWLCLLGHQVVPGLTPSLRTVIPNGIQLPWWPSICPCPSHAISHRLSSSVYALRFKTFVMKSSHRTLQHSTQGNSLIPCLISIFRSEWDLSKLPQLKASSTTESTPKLFDPKIRVIDLVEAFFSHPAASKISHQITRETAMKGFGWGHLTLYKFHPFFFFFFSSIFDKRTQDFKPSHPRTKKQTKLIKKKSYTPSLSTKTYNFENDSFYSECKL